MRPGMTEMSDEAFDELFDRVSRLKDIREKEKLMIAAATRQRPEVEGT